MEHLSQSWQKKKYRQIMMEWLTRMFSVNTEDWKKNVCLVVWKYPTSPSHRLYTDNGFDCTGSDGKTGGYIISRHFRLVCHLIERIFVLLCCFGAGLNDVYNNEISIQVQGAMISFNFWREQKKKKEKQARNFSSGIMGGGVCWGPLIMLTPDYLVTLEVYR